MSKLVETLRPVVGAFLKYEATPLTRVAVTAPKGTKAGTFVDAPLRDGKKLLALTDEADGTVLVREGRGDKAVFGL